MYIPGGAGFLPSTVSSTFELEIWKFQRLYKHVETPKGDLKQAWVFSFIGGI